MKEKRKRIGNVYSKHLTLGCWTRQTDRKTHVRTTASSRAITLPHSNALASQLQALIEALKFQYARIPELLAMLGASDPTHTGCKSRNGSRRCHTEMIRTGSGI